MGLKSISFVVPCYNEEDVVEEFYRRVAAVSDGILDYDFEFVFINDGSVDNTAAILNRLADADRRVKVLHLSKNQGHQAAITAGTDFSRGDVIVTMDVDLQDPPEALGDMLGKISEGYDVVHMKRKKRKGETWFKLITAWGFYKLMNRLTGGVLIENSGDFRAFTRPVLKAVRSFREQHRYMRGIFAIVGFRQCVLEYDRQERYAGKTKYPLVKMLRFATNAVLSFSSAPVRLIIWLAVLLWGISLIYLTKALIDHYVYNITVQGWTSIIILMTFFTGIIIFCLSIIASYVGRIFEQGQRRPIYWLSDARNIDLSTADMDLGEVKLSSDILEKK